jgi:hypothetical protein
MPTNAMFDIVKFCNKSNTGLCGKVEYAKLKTGGNDPKLTKSMQYSQILRTAKPKSQTKILPDTFSLPRTGNAFIQIFPRLQYGTRPFLY